MLPSETQRAQQTGVSIIAFSPDPDAESEALASGVSDFLKVPCRPEDLRRLNRIELAVMGVGPELADRFLTHLWYSPRHGTILIESLVLCLVAAGIGLGVAAWAFPPIFGAFGLAAPPLPNSVYAIGFGVAAALALVVAIWPAWRARTLPIAQAVSGR